MTRFFRKCLLISTVVAASTAVCFAAGDLTAYRASVTYKDIHQASVDVAFSVAGKSGPQSVQLIVYPGQKIEAWQAGDSTTLPEVPPGAGGITIPFPFTQSGMYGVKYNVVSTGELSHVPLPVPDSLPVSREHFVQIDLSLPPDSVVYDDPFPQKVWRDSLHGIAQLPAVPAVIAVRFAPAGQVSWRMKWSSVGRLSTLFMMLMLIVGSAALFLYRPRSLINERRTQ